MATRKLIDSHGGSNRHKVNTRFFSHWSHKMAYVLGFLYADGNITNAISSRAQYISFVSTDRCIIEQIKSALQAAHPIQIREPHTTRHRNGIYKSRELYRLRIGSKVMFNDLLQIGVTPNKSKTITFPKIPPLFLRHFIRGYFDGDGCVSVGKRKAKNNNTPGERLVIVFTSGSILFLKMLAHTLHKTLAIKQKKVYKSTRAFQLKYSIRDSSKIFEFMCRNVASSQNIYLSRKFKVFQKYFYLSPQRRTRCPSG